MEKETPPKPTEPLHTTEVAFTAEGRPPKEEEEPMTPTDDKTPTPMAAEDGAGVTESVSFKKESNVVSDLQDSRKKALNELKLLIRIALANKEFDLPTTTKKEDEDEKTQETITQENAVEPSDSTPVKEEEDTREAKTEEKVDDSKTEEKTEEMKTEVLKANEDEEKTQEVKTEETEEELKTEEKTKEMNAGEVKGEESSASTPVKGEEEKSQEAKAEEKTEEFKAEDKTEEPLEEIFIWGVPLLGDEKSDTVLLKFLHARDFKVKEAMTMIKDSVIWRKQFGIDALIDQDLEIPELEKAVFNHGFDKEGHPVCYNVFGEFQNKDLYAKAFGDEEKREKFLRWRIQYLEKGIREKLDFSPGGVCSIVQVNDLKNTAGPGKEFRVATKKALTLLQDNYPEFVAKQVFINVPWWYLGYNMVISSIFTQRSKSKFVFAGPSKSTETLFKYIAPEQVPVQYGGLSKDNDPDFTTSDVVTEVTIKPARKHTIEIPATEGSVLIWELRVLGWEVSYSVEFSPNAEDGYTVIVQKARKFVPTDEPYMKNSFKIGEPGKIILTVDNATSKKKKLLYRSKEKGWTKSARSMK